jgi:C-terminal processing protease CtpA/Prc
MKISIIISILIHSLFFLNFISNQQEEKLSQTNYDIGTDSFDIDVIEINESDSGEISKQELKAHYWGIGISSNYIPYNGTLSCEIEYIYSGYSAESAGLQIGDIIYLINGAPIGDNNDIKGDGPRKMLLTVSRKNVIIYINIDRVKVYY